MPKVMAFCSLSDILSKQYNPWYIVDNEFRIHTVIYFFFRKRFLSQNVGVHYHLRKCIVRRTTRSFGKLKQRQFNFIVDCICGLYMKFVVFNVGNNTQTLQKNDSSSLFYFWTDGRICSKIKVMPIKIQFQNNIFVESSMQNDCQKLHSSEQQC